MAYIPQGITSLVSTVPSSVQTGVSVMGHAPVVIVGGSILTSSTPNQSVSGSVGIEGTPTFLQLAGSVMATSATVSPAANQSVSGTVGASVIGHAPVVIVGGSILTSSTPNQSVSGTVNVGNFPTTQNVSGSVVAQNITPSSLLVGASIVGLPPVNVTNFPTTQNISGSVVAFQGTPEWTIKSSLAGGIIPISGSVGAVITNFPANQSVSGSVGIAGTPTFLQLAGSILATSATVTPAANQSVSGTVDAQQIGTRVTSLVSTVPSSVIVGASIFGHAPVVIVGGSVATATTNSSVMLLNGANAIGSVTVLQGTNPFIITGSIQGGGAGTEYTEDAVGPSDPVGGTLTFVRTDTPSVQSSADGDVVAIRGTNYGAQFVQVIDSSGNLVNSFGGGTSSVVQQGTWRVSVVGSTPSSLIAGASIFGQLPAGTAPLGSVATLQGTMPWIITGSVQGAGGGTEYAEDAVVPSVTGTAIMFRANQSSSIMDVVSPGAPLPVSVQGTVNIGTQSGSVVAFQGTTPWLIGSVYGNISGSVAATITNTNVNVSGSVAAFKLGTWVTSLVSTVPSSVIVGTSIFGQLPAGTAPLGSVATLQGTNPWNVAGSVAAFQAGTRITSISGIPQASVHGAVTFLPASVVSGHGSVNGAASVQLLAAPGTGLYNYLTDFTLSNTGAATTLVTFTDGDASVIGRSIAPTGGGAIAASFATPMKALKINGVINMVAATATSVLYGWAGGYKAP